MKIGNRDFQLGLRILIVIGSMLGFLSSWMLFAHSGKPVATTSVDVPIVQPLAPAGSNQGLDNQSQPSFGLQPVSPFSSQGGFGVTRFRTSGS